MRTPDVYTEVLNSALVTSTAQVTSTVTVTVTEASTGSR